MTDEKWMREALRLAEEAAADGEVPVGCVVTLDDKIGIQPDTEKVVNEAHATLKG